MSRGKNILLVFALLLVAGLALHFRPRAPLPESPLTPEVPSSPPTPLPTVSDEIPADTPGETRPPAPAFPALTPPDHADLSPIPPHPDTLAFGTPDIPPEREPVLLLTFFEAYRERFGAYPAGEDNAQFMNALRGNNPARLGIFPLNHPRLDTNGQLLDAWGNPFIFHKLSRDHLEIRSMGPDQTPYTEDDLLAPRRPRNR